MARVGVTGHQALPPRTALLVDHALRVLLERLDDPDLVGITCLADGADQLFARAVLDCGGALEVVVPAERYRDGLEPASARAAYDHLFARACQVERLTFSESTERAHLAAGRFVVEASDVLVAVWDGEPARGLGGTADVVRYAHELGVPVEIVWPPGASRG
ncbi:MAG: hypothetical protein ACRDYA_09415 [Egibacteraceae bacterium]